MSGKSTLLDGLRLAIGHPMPSEPTVRKDVEGRARERFLSGGATCSIDICGPVAPTEPDVVRWPAKFYTQRELQAAVNDQGSRRRLLYRLIPETSEELTELDAKTGELDGPRPAPMPSSGCDRSTSRPNKNFRTLIVPVQLLIAFAARDQSNWHKLKKTLVD